MLREHSREHADVQCGQDRKVFSPPDLKNRKDDEGEAETAPPDSMCDASVSPYQGSCAAALRKSSLRNTRAKTFCVFVTRRIAMTTSQGS